MAHVLICDVLSLLPILVPPTIRPKFTPHWNLAGSDFLPDTCDTIYGQRLILQSGFASPWCGTLDVLQQLHGLSSGSPA